MTLRSRSLRRSYGQRPERQRFLIYCEGELTEVSYFKGVRRELRAGTVQIELGRQHGEPHGLVRDAIDHQRRAPDSERDRFEAYDQVWCVFDVEAPQPHPKLDAALRMAAKHDVRCAVTNPCFELWLLLHFRDQLDYLTTAEACRRLEACGCGYRHRAKQPNYEQLRDGRLSAHDRATRLDQRHAQLVALQDRNPWTSVHVLVEALFSLA